ncbi:protein kinase [Streptomyces sp. NPDC090025]|uniref:protein kinase n=1 Tax=Streptomyces sp. NPDC090025 TaxID=3365922 RepID=UPI00383792C7
MDDYAGRVLADRYRLPLPPPDTHAYPHELAETRAFDTYSGQEVRIRQVPLPEVVDAELLDGQPYTEQGRATRRPAEPTVRRAVEAAQAAARIPDHPRLDQVFDVFAEGGSLWIVSEFVPATPLSELLAEGPLSPFRAAEIGADLLTALRALHAHGWTHRNVTARTVLVCDDGRVVLTGLAAGAAEEALCGYAPVPDPDEDDAFPYRPRAAEEFPAAEAEAEVYEAETYDTYDTDDTDGTETHEDEAYGAEGYEDDADTDADARPYGRGESGPPELGRYATGGAPYGAFPDTAAVPAPIPAQAPAPYPYHDTVLPPARSPEPYPDQTYPDETYVDERGQDGDAYPDETYLDTHPDTHPDGGEGDAPAATGYGPHGGTPYGPARGARPEPPAVPPAQAGPVAPPAADPRARAGAIAAYRAGARAAAAIGDTGSLPAQRPAGPQSGPQSGPPAGPPVPPEPQWWARPADDGADDGDDDDTYDAYDRYGPEGPDGPHHPDGPDDEGGTRPPRAYLIGNWSDGPHASRDGGPAGGGPGGGGPVLPALPAGYRAAAPDPVAEPMPAPAADSYRGPVTRLAAERARQTRMAVVGAVTERWAPEQAGPVHEHWRLAPPIGPATDLWALGALLYRAVQGHAPYPEDNVAELVQLVCAEPPAFAEESGPLRPVVESLLRQDPTERLDVEELSGWLRSLVRSAPEPDAGTGVVPLPSPDATRLPIVRRRGELVRRWRGGAGSRRRHAKGREGRGAAGGPEYVSSALYADEPAGSGPRVAYAPAYTPTEPAAPAPERAAPEPRPAYANQTEYAEYAEYADGQGYDEIPQRASRAPRAPGRPSGSPRNLGRTLLVLVLVLLAAAIVYAAFFMPRQGAGDGGTGKGGTGKAPSASGVPATPSGQPPTTGGPSTGTGTKPTPGPTATTARPTGDPSTPALAEGYQLHKDPEGFQVGLARGWRRSPINDAGQVRFTNGDFTLIVVPGRDSVRASGADPLAYQNNKERELQPWRDSSWAGASGLRRIDIGQQAMAVGQFTWPDSTGREVFVRNLALIDRGRYHVVQVIGPDERRDKVSEIYDQAVKVYRATR